MTTNNWTLKGSKALLTFSEDIMSSFSQCLFQFVFATKRREKTLTANGRELLYRHIWGILKNYKCKLYRIGGTEDHIHIILALNPHVCPSFLIKEIKLSSSFFIKEKRIFPKFNGWQKGYGAFTYSFSARGSLIEYVMNQKEHHKKLSFMEEYKNLLEEHCIEYDGKFLFED